MPGYLLDTQTLRYWFDGPEGRFSKVKSTAEARAARHPAAPLYISAITIGEIEFGHQHNAGAAPERREAFQRFIEKQLPPNRLSVTKHTAKSYGLLRAKLVERFPPQDGWSKKKRVEQLYDPIAGREFGFDENDIWIAAQALERNLVMVTNDKKFTRRAEDVAIEVADLLGATSFGIENWVDPGEFG